MERVPSRTTREPSTFGCVAFRAVVEPYQHIVRGVNQLPTAVVEGREPLSCRRHIRWPVGGEGGAGESERDRSVVYWLVNEVLTMTLGGSFIYIYDLRLANDIQPTCINTP